MDEVRNNFNESFLCNVGKTRLSADIDHNRQILAPDVLREFTSSGEYGFDEKGLGLRRIRNQVVIFGTLLTMTAYFYMPLLSFLMASIVCLAIVAALTCCVEGQQCERLKKSLEGLGRAYEKFLENDVMCRLLAENVRGIVYSTDRSGAITYVSPRLKENTGWITSDLIGLNFTHLLEESERRKARLLFRRLLQQGGIGTGELRIKAKNGSLITGELKTIVIRDSNDTPKGCFGIVRDVSKKLQMTSLRGGETNLTMCLPQTTNTDVSDQNPETRAEAPAYEVACDLNNWPTLTLSAKQISRVLGISKAAVTKRARKEYWEYDPMVKQGGVTRFFFVYKIPEPTRTSIKNRLNLTA